MAEQTNTKEQLLRAEEVALLIGISTQTLNTWYRWKKSHADHVLAKLLPDFIQSAPRQIRKWKKSDIWALTEFKNALPHGRNGILGDTTQRYFRKSRIVESALKECEEDAEKSNS